ncbi:MAG TPA: hydroxyacid dehydrogenase [Ktedonobacteraceae bacterium]|jgi:phosphoglycerate dehydrogenase-like enzyme
MSRPKGIFILNSTTYNENYREPLRSAIGELVELVAPHHTAEEIQTHLDVLREVEIILSGWGAPIMDEAFLAHAPHLRAVFYGSGSIRGFVTDALWERGIIVTSAQSANAMPVAEYTLAAILFSLKHGWQLARQVRKERLFPSRANIPGTYGATIGIISLGMVGRLVREYLRPFDLQVLAYDPYITPSEAAALDVSLCSLEALFRESQVVTLHTPLLPETTGMIRGVHLASMPEGSTFINTSRGGVVQQEELIAVLERRTDLYAVLDVTRPEPPPPDSPLYVLPNVTLTPHIAGALGSERRRLGEMMLAELQRFIAGGSLRHTITREQVLRMATP